MEMQVWKSATCLRKSMSISKNYIAISFSNIAYIGWQSLIYSNKVKFTHHNFKGKFYVTVFFCFQYYSKPYKVNFFVKSSTR